MQRIFRYRYSIAAALIAVFLAANTSLGQSIDLKILQKALTKALGQKSNFGTERLIALREESKEGENILVVGVIANNNPTAAGLRHGVLTDAVNVLRVLKDWDWADKADRIVIGEYIPQTKGPNTETRQVMTLVVSSETLRSVEWRSFDPRKVAEVADVMKLDDPIR